MFEINPILADLAMSRPVFHSEADFQHALAWEIQKRFPIAKIRLEVAQGNQHIDILIDLPGGSVILELKYKTSIANLELDGERFSIQNHGAQPVNRRLFLNDIFRVENFIQRGYANKGVAVFLTNDSRYWRPNDRPDPIDSAFRLHEGAILKGEIAWGVEPVLGLKQGWTNRLS